MPQQGSIAITARGDNSRWYGRISIPQALAAEAGLSAGMRINATCRDGRIVIFPDENGRIKFPGATGKSNPRHAFEAATATLGLREIQLPQSAAAACARDGGVHIDVPAEFVATESKPRRKAAKSPIRAKSSAERPPLPPMRGIYGATAAVLIDASRAGKKVRPMSARQVVELLRELGKEVVPHGQQFRLFRFEGATATISDLLEAANKLTADLDQGPIILEMD